MLDGYPRIIGLSGKARHGKNTIAELAAYPFWAGSEVEVHEVGFADGVKDEARQSYGWSGEKDVRGRTLLQRIGMNRRREDPEYWVKRLGKKLVASPARGHVYFVTDVRFENEAKWVKDIGGLMWRVNRRNEDGSPFDNGLTPEQALHPSETALDDYKGFNITFDNALDIELLRQQVHMAVTLLLKRWRMQAA